MADNPLAFLKERLRLSAIPLEAARYAGIEAMTVGIAKKAGYQLPGYPSDGFLLRYYDARSKLIPSMWRWRNGRSRKNFRYVQPPGTGCWPYFPRVKGLNWRKVLADPRIEVFIVEGELKALSLTLAGVPAVGLGGVWNYLLNKELLPELRQLAEGGRSLFIAFDSDTESKDQVKRARFNLANLLLKQRADPRWLTIPHLADTDSPDKTGVDDLVRVCKLKDQELRDHLKTLEIADGFEIKQHLLRLNTEYVLNRHNAHVHELQNPDQSWNDLTFARVIENIPVIVGLKTGKNGKNEDVVAKVGRAWLDSRPLLNEVVGRAYHPQEQDAERSPYVTVNGKRYLNNWTGWASEPEPDPEGVAKYWTPLLDHLFCPQGPENEKQRREREKARRWLEMWFAYPIQHPGANLYSCVAMLGAQGGGKTLLGNIVGWACYGRHFIEITQDQLDSRFNASWAANRSFLMGSEVTSLSDWKAQRKVSEILKHWITCEEIQAEGKGKDSYPITNTINFYFTANKTNAFFLEDDDRRYFIYSIPNVKLDVAKGREWVRQLDAYIRSEKGKAALHYHLLNEVKIDPTIFDPKGSPPDTEAKRNAKEYSQNTAEHWLAQFYESPEEFTNHPRGQCVFRVEEVHNEFLRSTHSDVRAWSIQAFTRIFRTRFISLGRAVVPVRKGNTWAKKKTGLWIKQPNYNGGSATHILTLAEAKKIWTEQTSLYKLESGLR